MIQRKAERLAALSRRIRVLEDALLAEGCANHPVLHDKASVKARSRPERVEMPDRPHDKAGTLAISEFGGTTYLGASAIEVRTLLAHS